MKTITLTEDNIKQVYGRLRKFFFNKNGTSFESWHNFDCGFKKHISPYIMIAGSKTRIVHVYPTPDSVEFIDKNGGMIIIRLTEDEAASLEVGDKIAFYGNRITYRQKWIHGSHDYIYSTFQVLPISEIERRSSEIMAELDAME